MIPIAPHITAFLQKRLPVEQRASPHTCDAYAYAFQLLFEFMSRRFGVAPSDLALEQLDAPLVLDFLDHLQKQRGNTPRTRNARLAAIRSFMRFVEQRVPAVLDQVRRVRAIPAQKTNTNIVQHLTDEEQRALLDAPDPTTRLGIRDRAMLVLMAMHGLRVVECHRLSLEDVDLEAGEAGQIRVFGKGDKWRTVLLTEETREVLRMWLAARALMRSGCRAVFLTMHWTNACSDPGERISTRGIRRMVNHYLEVVGAKKPGVSCHALRHSYATLSLAAGASLLAISGSLGHSSVTTTQVYAKIVDKARNNPAKLLGGLL